MILEYEMKDFYTERGKRGSITSSMVGGGGGGGVNGVPQEYLPVRAQQSCPVLSAGADSVQSSVHLPFIFQPHAHIK